MKNSFVEALIYFEEAEKLLEYAASCGKSLDRDIILTILNNKAFIFRNSWNLDQSLRYVEAIIFNLKEFIDLKENVEIMNKASKIIREANNSEY